MAGKIDVRPGFSASEQLKLGAGYFSCGGLSVPFRLFNGSLLFTHEMPVTIPTSVVTNRTASRYGLGAKLFPVKTHCVQVYNKCKKTEESSMNYRNSTGEL